MAAQLSGPGASSKYAIQQNNEINVTPFVDIMLVLLIIFMVAASVAVPSVIVAMPNAVAPPATTPPKPIYISIQRDGKVFVGNFPTTKARIAEDLKKQINGKRDPAKERIYIRADKGARYGAFMDVMVTLQDSGFYSVALVGEDKKN